MSTFTPFDQQMMQRALQLARQGEGEVEPNPLVGCVLTQNEQVLGEGWHQKFGGPHAEIEALTNANGDVRGGTAYVTLEPCCHHGKTPPCSAALIQAGITRVVAALCDPYPRVAGGGLAQLRAAGIEVTTGLCEAAARELNAPYLKRLRTGLPWVIAKWGMTLDGKIATATGESQWISGAESRTWVHRLRGRMDGILVGKGTVEADDPLLTARPTGPRVATRIVLDRRAELRNSSQLVRTVREAPVLVSTTSAAPEADLRRLQEAGCEVCLSSAADSTDEMQVLKLLQELGRRQMTNLLVEGGGQILGSFLTANAIDEVHVFVAPKLIGGKSAPGPVLGSGLTSLAQACKFDRLQAEASGPDWHLFGRKMDQV